MLIFTSIPKSGTHLARAVLEDLIGPPGPVLHKGAAWRPRRPWTFCAHIRYEGQPLCEQARVLVLVRDPRAIALSLRDFIMGPKGGRVVHPSVVAALEPLSLDHQVRRIAKGVRTEHDRIAPLGRHCSGFLEWPGAIILKYETMFSAAGAAAIQACLPHLSLDRINQALARTIGQETSTLNVGDPDRWRTMLDPETIRLVETCAGALLTQLGYTPFG